MGDHKEIAQSFAIPSLHRMLNSTLNKLSGQQILSEASLNLMEQLTRTALILSQDDLILLSLNELVNFATTFLLVNLQSP